MFDKIISFLRPAPVAAGAVHDIEALVARSQELGRQMDALREQRLVLRQQIDALIAQKNTGG